ncbi:MAG: hypothetical protein ACD_75C01303G0001 [uncultured bacterium]|nr:MAG: hypothetical protein ACD_75C01303G0001 [uncultured bacterium]
MDDDRFGDLEAYFPHGIAEFFPAFRLLDDCDVGGKQLDVIFVENAHLGHLDRGVEGGLATKGRQQGVGTLFFDDFRHEFRSDRLDIGGVGQLRIGHDGGRIGIDQDYFIAFLFQGLHRLGAGIVEFAGLADDDGAGADDEDFFDVCSFRHVCQWCLSLWVVPIRAKVLPALDSAICASSR